MQWRIRYESENDTSACQVLVFWSKSLCVLPGHVWVLLGLLSHWQHRGTVVSQKRKAALAFWTRCCTTKMTITSAAVCLGTLVAVHSCRHAQSCGFTFVWFVSPQSWSTAIKSTRLAVEGCRQTPTKPSRSWVGSEKNTTSAPARQFWPPLLALPVFAQVVWSQRATTRTADTSRAVASAPARWRPTLTPLWSCPKTRRVSVLSWCGGS